MTADIDNTMDQLVAWCASELGPVELITQCGKSHPGESVLMRRLRSGSGECYLKTHERTSDWEAEVHAYEQWTAAFGTHVPRLLAVREDEPRAIVVSALDGKCLEDIKLTPSQERAAWRDAGRAVTCLHDCAVGDFFGPCNRDGSPRSNASSANAREFISAQLRDRRDRGRRMGYLSADELAVVDAALELVPAFEGEPPVPCHRDYYPANGIVASDGTWVGVIDFEFSQWDVRAADFTRYPDWNWIGRPDLVAAFFEGYGALTPTQEQQRSVCLVRYALVAIAWGEDNEYHGFAREGHTALKHLANVL